jgi:UDP-N-acetylglucosamine 1-carboxyvinyltransferase
MEKLIIRGGKRLEGVITISGAKNAALPLMAASLLTDDGLRLSNLPKLADISTMAELLEGHGVAIYSNGGGKIGEGRKMDLKANNIQNTEAPYDTVRKMRASILVLGPLLARCGEATVSMPGGCAIGNRPIDLHLKGFAELGAEIELADGYVRAHAKKGLVGGTVVFPFVSVGATENLMMAAALARGTTILENAAREPEIADLAHCLIAMGAEISGIGTERLVIEGKEHLHGADFSVMPDRIEAGSYAVAAAITNGRLELKGARADSMGAVINTLVAAGVSVKETATGLVVERAGAHIKGLNVVTQPYPGFPTDMQAQIMAMMTLCDGAAMITETIFENRFMHVPELARMGADITVHGASAMVRGVAELTGAQVMATDLRASMSLVLAGLAAKGQTTVNRVYHLDRGYEHLEEKLQACGADIERVKA